MAQISVGIHYLVVWCFYRSRFCVCAWFCRMFVLGPGLVSISPLNNSVSSLW
jgi:hypothetical protein